MYNEKLKTVMQNINLSNVSKLVFSLILAFGEISKKEIYETLKLDVDKIDRAINQLTENKLINYNNSLFTISDIANIKNLNDVKVLTITQNLRTEIEIQYVNLNDKIFALKIVKILEDMLKAKSDIEISGEKYSTEFLIERFEHLEFGHIEFIVNKYNEVDYEIKNQTKYIRTMLFNSITEMELHYQNQYMRTLGAL